MTQFDKLAESRRQWISEVLQPWCATAPRSELRRAELEWTDLAGKVDPQATLWTWAWGRFPALVSEGMAGLDETHPVTVTLKSGESHTGYPDARESEHGALVLVSGNPTAQLLGPFSIDDIADVSRG